MRTKTPFFLLSQCRFCFPSFLAARRTIVIIKMTPWEQSAIKAAQIRRESHDMSGGRKSKNNVSHAARCTMNPTV